MSKFKVGDKVVGNKLASGRYIITKEGYTGTVTKVHDNGNIRLGGCYDVDPKYFDLDAPRHNKIVITTDGTATLARLYEGNNVIKSAEAICSPADRFDFNVGAQLAYNRLVYGTDYHPAEVAFKCKPKQEPVKLYCVKESDVSWVRVDLTKGKVYEFDGHFIEYDCGTSAYFNDLEDWKRGDPGYAACLVPLVSRPAQVGEYIRNNETGEVCEVIALSFWQSTYVRTKVGNETYSGDCADRKIEHPFDLLDETNYLVLDGYKPEPEKAESEYYSGKVVCVDNDGGRASWWGVGKVYDIRGGVIRDNDGTPRAGIKSVEWLNNMLDVFAKFIEFKGE